MARFIRSNILRRATSATAVISEDLPTSPLSHITIAIEGWNATNETTLAELLTFLNTIRVSDQGKVISYLQSEDLYALNCYLYRRRPILTQRIDADNTVRMLGLVIPFGRRIMDPNECYPARKKGDVKLEMDMTALATSIDNGQISIEVTELPDANPQRYLKTVLKTITAPGATGDADTDLPIGNKIVALQLRMTTFPGASSHAYGVDDVTVLKDNSEEGYVGNVAQSLVADGIHRIDGQSGTIAASGDVLPLDVVWVDYDPNSDGEYLLQTKGASSLVARLTMGVDEATFMTVMELVDV